MVQARRAGRADVHRRPLADRLEAFEDLDLVRAVVVRRAVPLPLRRTRGRGPSIGTARLERPRLVVLRFS